MALNNDELISDHVVNVDLNSVDDVPPSPVNNILRVCTYNMHGFNQGSEMLNHLCLNVHPDIIFIQEQWQSPDNLYKILSFSSGYVGFGISAFESKINTGILYGRPFGGVCILINKKYSNVIRSVICNERYVIIMIGTFAFVNVYLPCRSNLNLNDHFNSVNNIIDEINSHLGTLAPELIMFGGDLNTD